uniref:Cadherin domain-containing protein n=1 Tax=Labrus bergylta TaxID=56723 RepID=A0A3Q3E582_9LABR
MFLIQLILMYVFTVYFFSNTDIFFTIDPETGLLSTTTSLDREIIADFNLTVEAAEKNNPLHKDKATVIVGFPSLSSQIEMSFEVTDINQFSPSFREPYVTFSTPEDLSVGSVIGKIQAEDRDYGSNGAIMYGITQENLYLPFSIGETSGLLTLIRELDFEKEGVYYLQIKAMDGGWVSKTGMVNVTVVVTDVNDNPPVFSSSEYIISLPENSDIGSNVFDIKATDADSGVNAQIVYSLIAGHVDKFLIDSRSGTITTLVVFDYEQEQNFDLTIKATNIGGLTLFSLSYFVIQISDVNEFKPIFSKKELNFSVFKNVPAGTVIGKITATDDDQGPEGQVFYLMFGQKKYMGFEINKISGEIFTTRSLRSQGNSHTDFKVLAKNPGVITGTNVDETLVRVTVIDINEAPVFTSVLYVANMSEDSPIGTSVITVSALDEDSILDWNRFFFNIENGNTNSSFAVNPSSGVVSIISLLDRELWSHYNLTLTATDNGSPPATGTTNVIINVNDVNDNAPKLTFNEAHVKENQPQGTVVARLNASDSDLVPNQGPFTYLLVNPSTDSAFSLTSDGVLVTTRTFDREQISLYQVLVAATFNITVEATDQLHFPVNNSIYVNYKGFTNASIDNFYLFLSLPLLSNFLSFLIRNVRGACFAI